MGEKGYTKQNIPVEWVLVAGKGAYGDLTLSEQIFDGDTRHSSMTREEFEELWARSERILLRRCRDCSHFHKEIYYKRLNETSLPSNVDILYDVKEHWQEYENNKWGENFDLYSSYSNAINEKYPWNVWDTPYYNSVNGNTYFGQRSIGFYVAINPYYGQPTKSPTPEPTAYPTTNSPTAPPAVTVVSSASVTLIQQFSNSPCTYGVSFGIENDYSMWVNNGCRGKFNCNGNEIDCASNNFAFTNCLC